MSNKAVEFELKGRAWRVYWYMLSKGAQHGVTVREIQRALDFKSPSIAAHHLERLIDLGLVRKGEDGCYLLSGEIKIGVLRHFVRLGRVLVPRFIFYATFSTMLLVLYAMFIPQSKDFFASSFAIALGVFSSATFWYEAYRFWKLKPY